MRSTGSTRASRTISCLLLRTGPSFLSAPLQKIRYFEVNSALLSRSIIFELKALTTENIRTLILRAVNDCEKGMGNYRAVIDEDAVEFLADMAGGDARNAP